MDHPSSSLCLSQMVTMYLGSLSLARGLPYMVNMGGNLTVVGGGAAGFGPAASGNNLRAAFIV